MNWVYDYETIVDCFLGIFEDFDSDKRRVFIISDFRNDFSKMLKFFDENIKNGDWHYGFNCDKFDGQITQFMLKFRKPLESLPTSQLITTIYQYAQETIRKSNANEYLDFKPENFQIKTIDIMSLNNWDSNAKRASLKWVQYTMDWDDIREMPYPHYEPVKYLGKFQKIVEYCFNDVHSTKAIFLHKNSEGKQEMLENIKMRKEFSEKYGLHLYSAPEPRIAKEIFLHLLAKKMECPAEEIKRLRSYRKSVAIKNILLPYIKFDTPEFKAAFNWEKSLDIEIDNSRNVSEEEEKEKGPSYEFTIGTTKTKYGMGGLHGCNVPGVYESTDETVIVSVDVESYYPNLGIRNKWSPAHLPQSIFCELYEWMFNERKKYKKGSALNYLYKIILNATYGLSKNIYSFLYDPMYTYRITFNGQLLLSMLYERVLTRIPHAVPLMQNTDGMEFIIDRRYVDEFHKICADWEKLTKLHLEDTTYSKMIIADVNNYIALHDDPKEKPKRKGRFQFNNLPLHKNKSFLVIPKAISAYFIDGIDPKDYVYNCQSILDFCGGVKTSKKYELYELYVEKGIYKEIKHKKIARYFVSKNGTKLVKRSVTDGSDNQVEADYLTTLYNTISNCNWKEELNYRFYLNKIQAEIDNIESGNPAHQKQTVLTLF